MVRSHTQVKFVVVMLHQIKNIIQQLKYSGNDKSTSKNQFDYFICIQRNVSKGWVARRMHPVPS